MIKLRNWCRKRSTVTASPPKISTKHGVMLLLNILEFGSRSKGFSKALSNDTPSKAWRLGRPDLLRLLDREGSRCMTTDTSERGLERLICTALTGGPCDPGSRPANWVKERPSNYGVGWIGGEAEDYDREYCVDLAQLTVFLLQTQPDVAEHFELGKRL